MKRTFTRASLLAVPVLMLLLVAGRPWIAPSAADDPPGQSIAEKLGLPTNVGPKGKAVKVSATFSLAAGKRRGQLHVTARIAPRNHLYSVTQKPGGPLPTRISIVPAPRSVPGEKKGKKIKLLGPWVPNKKPKIKTSEFFPVLVEEHHGTVTWTAPFEIPAAVAGKDLKLQVKLDGQVCTDDLLSCMEVKETVTAKYVVPRKPSGKPQPAATITPRPVSDTFVAQQVGDPFAGAGAGFEDPFGHITISGQAVPRATTPGASVRLSFTLAPIFPYHVYDYAAKDPENSVKPTLLVLKAPEGWQVTGPETDEIAVLPTDPAGQPYYDQPVTWTLTVKIPEGTSPGEYELSGGVGYQVCKEDACDPPAGVDYRVRITVAAETEPEAVALNMEEGDYSKIAQQALLVAGITPIQHIEGAVKPELRETSQTGSATEFLGPLKLPKSGFNLPLWLMILLLLIAAFAAGFILNFMPCVLPVIGLKIVSFVQQAGESRLRIFMLNLLFSLGLISVFMVLAVLAKVAGLGWGAQFQNVTFNIILTAVVFVFALSFLGIWEIPIPGFVASGKVSEVADREGPAGAFCKGILTTVLATPCSGPLLVPVFGWATNPKAFFGLESGTILQNEVLEFLLQFMLEWLQFPVFFCVGLGMAFPYLLIGTFPRLIHYLPKPGAWMETFKNIMGFVLLGTVVFLMTVISGIENHKVLPVFTFLIGLWAACWWVGRTPLTAELWQQARAWCGGLVVAALTGWLSFGSINNMMLKSYQEQAPKDVQRFEEIAAEQAEKQKTTDTAELNWQPYSASLLNDLIKEGKPVFVDFTADW